MNNTDEKLQAIQDELKMRPHRITIPLTEEEQRLICSAAFELGITAIELMRSSAFSRSEWIMIKRDVLQLDGE